MPFVFVDTGGEIVDTNGPPVVGPRWTSPLAGLGAESTVSETAVPLVARTGSVSIEI
jgi:hypothetical protein